jgi:hypothetical protein
MNVRVGLVLAGVLGAADLFASDVSTAVKGAASAAILLTITAIVLLAPALRPGVEGAATDHRM